MICLICSLNISASADNEADVNSTRASLYLSMYSVELLADSNGVMAVEMYVMATGYMTKLGVLSLYIEEKVNGTWQEYDTVYGVLHPDFYDYNTYSYLGEYEFNGVSGRQYRVTMTAYARNSNGYDTGSVMSTVVTCHNP